jgi:hypothetical protein
MPIDAIEANYFSTRKGEFCDIGTAALVDDCHPVFVPGLSDVIAYAVKRMSTPFHGEDLRKDIAHGLHCFIPRLSECLSRLACLAPELAPNRIAQGGTGGDGSAPRLAENHGIPRHAAEQDRADVARRRAQWKKYQSRLDPKRLVFIDETWAKTNMTRRHGRCIRGTRLVAKVPHGRWRTLTFLAALRCDRLDAPCVVDGPINGASFLAYVEQVLVPTLRPGDIVVMDNLGSTSGKPSAEPSAPPAPSSSSCRPTRPTSIRSSRSSPSSRPCCVKPPNEPSKRPGNASARSWTHSLPPNAPTTSKTPATLQTKANVL